MLFSKQKTGDEVHQALAVGRVLYRSVHFFGICLQRVRLGTYYRSNHVSIGPPPVSLGPNTRAAPVSLGPPPVSLGPNTRGDPVSLDTPLVCPCSKSLI